MENKITKVILITMISAVGVCVPTIVILNIVRTGNWWPIIYIPCAIGIMAFAAILLNYSKGKPQ